jgi:peptidyl-tRNA hydrolase, PTH1 family
MYTIAGLGNPGAAYEHTRHNAGSLAVRAFQKTAGFPLFVSSSKFGGEISEGIIDGKEVRLFIPGTFMNVSGRPVRNAAEGVAQLCLVTDEVDLPLGTFKISYGSGSGGHNGVKSVIEAIGSQEFVRVRIGISPVSFFGTMKKPPKERIPDFVLGTFSKKEQERLHAVIGRVIEALGVLITEGKSAAMNRYN